MNEDQKSSNSIIILYSQLILVLVLINFMGCIPCLIEEQSLKITVTKLKSIKFVSSSQNLWFRTSDNYLAAASKSPLKQAYFITHRDTFNKCKWRFANVGPPCICKGWRWFSPLSILDFMRFIDHSNGTRWHLVLWSSRQQGEWCATVQIQYKFIESPAGVNTVKCTVSLHCTCIVVLVTCATCSW